MMDCLIVLYSQSLEDEILLPLLKMHNFNCPRVWSRGNLMSIEQDRIGVRVRTFCTKGDQVMLQVGMQGQIWRNRVL